MPHRQEYIDEYYNLVDEKSGRRFQATSLINPSQDRPNLTYEFHGHKKVWRWTRERMEQAEADGKIYVPPNGGVPRERRFLDEQEGTPVGSVWSDIHAVNSQAQERIGYPTQKPVALLERIIAASSAPGDVVLDPFCGCGTTIEAAERLGRRWIGIDVTHHAIEVIEGRLERHCSSALYSVRGRPADLESAHDLARRDKYEFQWWANWLIGVQNYRERKKGADKGIDGVIYFRNGPWGVGQIIVSVKGGRNIERDMIASLRGTVEREDAQLGLFVTLFEPTQPMKSEAAAAGFVTTAQGRFPKIQIVTVADLLQDRTPAMPAPIETEAFRQPLRPKRRTRAVAPDAQLTLTLPIPGIGRKPPKGVEEHLSGSVLAAISG